MAYDQSRKNKLIKNQPWLFLLCGFVILAMAFGGLYAKYVHQESKKKAPIAEKFYFTSDFLSQNGKNYTLASNTKQLEFELRNYQDDLRSSDSDINYNYVVKKDGTQITTGKGTIAKKADSGNKAQITINNLMAGKYTITAKAESPFHKTLSASFTIPEESKDLNYKVSDSKQSAYVSLQISTDAYEGNIKIQWPAGLIPDSTQKIFENTKNLQNGKYVTGSITVQVQKYTAYTYRFFKEDIDKDYSTTQDITVEKVTN